MHPRGFKKLADSVTLHLQMLGLSKSKLPHTLANFNKKGNYGLKNGRKAKNLGKAK